MGRFKLGVAAGGIVALGVAGGLGVAGADIRDEIKSGVKITSGGPNGAEGTVKSDEPKCEKGRTVALFYLVPAGAPQYRGGAGAQRIGSDKTNKDGEWAVNESLIAGDYYAKVKEKVVEVGKRHPAVLCKKKKSRNKRL